MPRPKHAKPKLDAPAADPAKAERVLPRKTKVHPTLTHERIAADMAAFSKAGGKIEVLGVTRTLTKAHAGDATPGSGPATTAPPDPLKK